MSKRTARPLLITTAVFLVAVFLAACSSTGASTSSSPTGGDVSIGWAEPVDSLNPAVTGARDVGPIDSNIFDGLVWLTPALKATPHLATSWKISPDGKTYTFTLEKGVKFQDNTAFNASSVVANIKYITAKTTQSTIAIGLLGPCLQAKAVSEYTVEIDCSTPYAPLLNNLGEPYLGMQSPAAITKWGADLGMHPTGT
ncbi:MAG: peptide/nickel transport system substrate-binding protein, partial [Actinomycetota bacterium]|nr:peptide/nickel transport system substrate-binding protein [Actinomycetota bacterium]